MSLGEYFVHLCRRLGRRPTTRQSARGAKKPGLEQLEERLVPHAYQYLLDLGTGSSPVAEDYTRVTRRAYDEASGFGWESVSNISAFSTKGSDPLTRDGHRGNGRGMFLVDVPDGTYHVTVTLGDAGAARDQVAILAEGNEVASDVTTARGQFQRVTFELQVTDGQLNLEFVDRGGQNSTFSVNAIQVERTSPRLDLIAAYGFEEGSGNRALDSSGAYHTGTIGGATWTDVGRFGNALSFDGVNDWVTVLDSSLLDLTGGMTIEAWVNPAAPAADWTTVALRETSGGLAYALYAADDAGRPPAGYVNTGSGDRAAAGSSPLPLNTWTHLAATYDGSVLRLYVNGGLAGSRSVSGNIVASAGAFRIGGNSVWGEYFRGLIDEVRVYGRALSQAEIQADMNTPVVGNNGPAPPTADAGADRSSDEGSAVSFQGSATGEGLSYAWAFGDGDTASGTLTPTHAYADNGNYTVTLTVTDSRGRSASDSALVTVRNVAPTASFTDDNPVDEGSPVLISFSDQNDPSSADRAVGYRYSYDFDNDGTFDIVDSTSPSASHTFTDNGTYLVRGRITDKDHGARDYTTTVEVSNVAPTATFTNDGPAVAGSAVTFSFSGQFDPSADDRAAGFRYSYDFNNDGTFDIVSSASATASHTFASAGSYTVRGRIADKDGGFTDYTTVVQVDDQATPPPTADAGADRSSDEGSSVSFQGSATGTGLSYAWAFGDGGTAGGTLTPSHAYADNGSYTVTLTVTDSQGRSASDTALVTVRNVAPTATLSGGTANEGSNLTVSFSNPADVSSADTAAGFRYSYDFNNDGTFEVVNSTSASASHAFDDNGSYTVRGRIADKDGGFTDYTTVVQVSNVAPTATFSNSGPVTAGSPVTFTFAGQNDPSGADRAAGYRYSYDFNNDGTFDVVSSASATASHTFASAGSYTVRGRIADKDGGTRDYTTTVTVNNPSQGRTLYVSATGSDSNDGSATNPFRTLQQAANVVTAGDTVIVRAGNYTGFNLPTSGTASARITFRGESGAVIDQAISIGGTSYGINASGKSYVTIEGFRFAPRADQPEWYAAIRLGGTPGAWVRNNIIRNNVVEMRVVGQSSTVDKYGIYTSWNDGLLVEGNTVSGTYNTGIYTANSARNYVIRANHVFNAGGNGIHNNGDLGAGGPGIIYNALIDGNVIHNVGFGIGGQAISCDGVQDSRIVNNLLYDIHAKGISLYATNGAEGSRRNIVANNTVLVASDGQVPMRINHNSSGNFVFNNIFLSATPSRAWIDGEESGLTGSYIDYNITTGVALVGGVRRNDWQSTYGFDTHSRVVTDPATLFVNMAANDYHLRAASIAIDAGRALQAPDRDKDGNVRPTGAGVDIGAYEYQG